MSGQEISLMLLGPALALGVGLFIYVVFREPATPAAKPSAERPQPRQ